MRKTRLFILTLIILSLSAAVAGCGGGLDEGVSEVTIIISDSQMARFDIKKPALLASVKNFINKILAVNEASAIPAGITDIRYSVSGSDISTITGVANVVNDTVKIVLYIPNGPQRHFVLDARYANSCVRYRGTTDIDLNGSPIRLAINMNLVGTDLCASNAAVSVTDITFNINNAGTSAVINGSFYYVQYQSGSNNLCRSGTSATIPANGSVAAGAVGIYPTSNNYRIIIDPLNAITETDDSNNEICSGTFCTSPPPLSIC